MAQVSCIRPASGTHHTNRANLVCYGTSYLPLKKSR